MSIDLVDPCVLSDRVLAISQCIGFAPALLWDDLALYSVSGGPECGAAEYQRSWAGKFR
ncbi:unnamed protein product, partial [Cladocopium goreaui]